MLNEFIDFIFYAILFGLWSFAMYKSGQESTQQDPSDDEDLSDSEDEA